MYVLSFITILIAGVALTLSLVQFFTRHRPALGVSGLEINNYPGGSETIAMVKNWGEIAGEKIWVTIGPYTYKNNVLEQRPRERYVGELFPNQEIRLTENFPTGVIENWAIQEQDVIVKVTITYVDSVARLLKLKKFRNYQQSQTYWVTQDSWGVMAP